MNNYTFNFLYLVFSYSLSTGAIAAELKLPEPDIIFPEVNRLHIDLGRLLFYDPILSGNKKTSCASCHHPRFGTSDGWSLGLGDGATGLGSELKIEPDNRPEQRISRNSPALFNLGAKQFSALFHDGRLEVDADKPGGLRTPLGSEMVSGFSGLLSAQAMFPVISPDEMAGHYSENDISKAVRLGRLTHTGGAWDIIASRVQNIPQYRKQFNRIHGIDRLITFTQIANVIAEFIAFEWRADDSPFDQYLRGEENLSTQAMQGLKLFYGKAQCVRCHSGVLQTDHGFHAIAMPQFGPGKVERFETHQRDLGRFRVTGKINDIYKFRTPCLRNVSLTAPYGHTGAYPTLETIVQHHLDPVSSLHAYRIESAVLPDLTEAKDRTILNDADEISAIATANELQAQHLTNIEVTAIIAFLQSLTDQSSLHGRLGVPKSVPSGLLIVDQ